jgi:hypothetical protein
MGRLLISRPGPHVYLAENEETGGCLVRWSISCGVGHGAARLGGVFVQKMDHDDTRNRRVRANESVLALLYSSRGARWG